MGYTVSVGTHKGGIGKSTVTCVTAWLLASQGQRTLVVDYDPQGNSTFILTQSNIYNFTGKTIYEAIQAQNANSFIQHVSQNLDLVPAEDFLGLLPRYLYTEYPDKQNLPLVLAKTLQPVKDQYDWILIDLPPQLGDITVTGIAASDYAIPLLESSVLCYDALDRYLETLEAVQTKVSPNLRLLGILPTMVDSRANIDSTIIDKARNEYGDGVFSTVIKRRARVKEWTLTGIRNDTREDREAMKQYESFLKEVLLRVRQKTPVV